MVSDHSMDGHMGALDATAGAAERRLEESGSKLVRVLVKGGLLEPEDASSMVGKGVGLAGQVRSKVLSALQSRPDTS